MYPGKVALTGESIKGFHNNGKYYLTNNVEEVAYYKTKFNNLLDKAQPLMEIYTIDKKNLFNSFISLDSKTDGNRRRILCSLPIHTISEELLLKILKRNNVPSIDISQILEFVKSEKETINNILKTNYLIDEFSEISKENFNTSSAPLLFLANSFYSKEISYTYEEYLEHLNLTKQFAENCKNYTLNTNIKNIFKNIEVSIHEDDFVMISKNSNPSIHFVIKHPKLRDSIENFIAPITE